MLPRAQKPTLRDFMLMQTQTRTRLCKDTSVFDPCVKLTGLTSFEKTTIMSWYSDTNVDKGLDMSLAHQVNIRGISLFGFLHHLEFRKWQIVGSHSTPECFKSNPLSIRY